MMKSKKQHHKLLKDDDLLGLLVDAYYAVGFSDGSGEVGTTDLDDFNWSTLLMFHAHANHTFH